MKSVNKMLELRDHIAAINEIIKGISINNLLREKLNSEIGIVMDIVEELNPSGPVENYSAEGPVMTDEPVKVESVIKIISNGNEELGHLTINGIPREWRIKKNKICTRATFIIFYENTINGESYTKEKTLHLPGEHHQGGLELVDGDGDKLVCRQETQ